MKERKYVKFRVDMYDDTKFKIIDMKPERDLIHYVWTRIVTLAGKVNLDGDLYMSRNIPYTIETLAIELNRGTYQVNMALDVLIELEMIELTEENIYRVKNFAKHQNTEKNERAKQGKNTQSIIKEQLIKIKENKVKDVSKNDLENNKQIKIKNGKDQEDNNTDTKGKKHGDEKSKKEMNINKRGEINQYNIIKDLEIRNKNVKKIHADNSANKGLNSNEAADNHLLLEALENNKVRKKKKEIKGKRSKAEANDTTNLEEERNGDDAICFFTDGEIALDKDEVIITEWSFE